MRLMIPAIGVSLLSALSPPKIIDQGVRKELDDLGLEPWRHVTKLHTDLLSSPARSRCRWPRRSEPNRPAGDGARAVHARPCAPLPAKARMSVLDRAEIGRASCRERV